MSRNGSGVYIAPASSFPAVPATLIESTKFNTVINDIGSAMSQSISADGQTTITNNIPLNGNKITGSGAATANGDLVRYEQILAPLVMTGYAGADVTLGIGQHAIYDITAATSLLLRIATADNQEYELTIKPLYVAGTAGGAGSSLSVNNGPLAGFVAAIMRSNATAFVTSTTAQTAIILDHGFSVYRVDAKISTSTICKSAKSSSITSSNVNANFGDIYTYSGDTTTAITSLGTITFGNARTGRVIVKRVA